VAATRAAAVPRAANRREERHVTAAHPEMRCRECARTVGRIGARSAI
jgi:hypothetical protein